MFAAPYASRSGNGWVLFDKQGETIQIILPGEQRPRVSVAHQVPTKVRLQIAQLEKYFAGRGWKGAAALADRAGTTEFSRRVYSVVARIPAGQTLTYAEVAAAAGRPRAARAVGNLMAANRFPVLIPCHRVVAANSLGGFGGRQELKAHLLELDRNHG